MKRGAALPKGRRLLGRRGLQAVAGSERKMCGAAEDDALLQRERVHIRLRVDELVALSGRQVSHVADGAVDGLAAAGRQLFELLEKLAGTVLLVGGQVLPGFHAVEHALLLLRRQAGKMLQAVSQPCLLLRRQPAKLRIAFERAALLGGRQIFIVAEPVTGVARLVLRRKGSVGVAGIGTCLFRTIFLKTFFLPKPVPLPFRIWGRMLRSRRLPLGERTGQQQRCQTARNGYPAQHSLPLCVFCLWKRDSPRLTCFVLLATHSTRLGRRDAGSRASPGKLDLRICSYIVLHLQFVEHIEIGV